MNGAAWLRRYSRHVVIARLPQRRLSVLQLDSGLLIAPDEQVDTTRGKVNALEYH